MLKEAAAVVIGSGALGASVAYHLAETGLGPIALLDQHEIGSQTSPRAAGLTQKIRNSDLMTKLACRSVDKIQDFTRATGQPLVYHRSGSLKIARTRAHAEQLRAEVARGNRLGVDLDFISANEAVSRMPFLVPVGIEAITFSAGDLYLEPGQISRGYAAALAANGGHLIPHTRVQEITRDGRRISGVRTEHGEIATSVVVDAAGAWTRLVGAQAGVRIGLVPTRHQLFITEPLTGVDSAQPITRVMDCNVYIRPADGGLMLGGYEASPLQIDIAGLPLGFSVGDLALDLGVLRELGERVAEQFPVFRDAPVREHRGGLPTMTADGEHIVGPSPEIEGFYVASGCCVGGLSIAPILGELLARWIVSGSPGVDLSLMSPARPLVSAEEERGLAKAARRQYAYHYWANDTRPQLIPTPDEPDSRGDSHRS